MERKKAVVVLIVLVVVACLVAAFKFWPKQYTVGQSVPQAQAFWNNHDAFVFLNLNTTGRARNIFQEKLAGTRYGYLSIFLGGYVDFSKENIIAFHLASGGQLDRFPHPEHTTTYGTWSLVDGQLQLAPTPSTTRTVLGFRWDGAKFVPVASNAAAETPAPSPEASKLTADDENDDDDAQDYGVLNKATRQEFKSAGWHYKFLTGYGNGRSAEATLPITLDGNTFDLTIESALPAKGSAAGFDLFSLGAKSIRLSGDKLATSPQVLWGRAGWQPISREEYQSLKQQYGRPRYQSPVTWVWLAVLLFAVLWRFAGWAHLLFTFGTMKGRVLKSMATSYSFPPATPAQFPLLDSAGLDRYTREFEGMGFTRLLDFSLVSDAKTNVPNFCRLFAHTRHHCFATVNQFFPKGKASMPVKCSLEGSLQNGWTLAFSDRKPQAASSLLRRRRAIGVGMPEATTSELLQAFLKMRDQVCLDLGIRPLNDDTLEGFIAKMQRSVAEMRGAVQQKSFVKGLPEVYLRKLSLLKTKPEYVWLGDYPKEAEQRKQGMSSFAAGAK